jgi:hypothetical protein
MPATELTVRELEAAVDEVNRIWLAKGLEAARAVGVYLLGVFYGGDLQAWREGQAEAPGVRALMDHPRLRMDKGQVWSSLRLVEQLDELGHDLGGRLTITAHQALFRIGDTRTKRTLAKRAADEGWPVARVVERVRELVPTSPGRPRHPVEEALRKLERASKWVTDPASVATLVEADATPGQIREWAERLEHRALLVDAVAGRLRRRLLDED